MKRDFQAKIFQDPKGRFVAELVHQETGRAFFCLAPKTDRRGSRLRPLDTAWVTMGKDKKLYYYRVRKRTRLSAKVMRQISEEIDRLFPCTKSSGSASDT